MALVVSGLESSIRALLASKPAAARVAAAQFAQAYQSYAATAQAGTTLPVFAGTEGEAVKQALTPAFNAQSGTAATVAAAWAQGVTQFWLASPAPVSFTDGVQAGVVPAVPGAPILTSTLTGLFANPRNTEQSVAFTLERYAHVLPQQQSQAAALLAERIFGGQADERRKQMGDEG